MADPVKYYNMIAQAAAKAKSQQHLNPNTNPAAAFAASMAQAIKVIILFATSCLFASICGITV